MKTDKSSKVGGRRNAASVSTAPKSRNPRGRKITHARGHKGYHGK